MFARTKRLTLRPGWREDAPGLAAAIAHESVVSRLSRVPWPYAEEDAANWLTRPRAIDDIFCLILAHETPTPHLVGAIGLHPAEGGGAHELGYWLTPAAWGRGYATEAGRQVVEIARDALGLRRLVAGHFADNPASGRVLAKLGFRPTGQVVQQYALSRGTEVPCVRVALDLAPATQPRLAA